MASAIARIKRTTASSTVTTVAGASLKQQLSSRVLQPQTDIRLTSNAAADPSRVARAQSDANSVISQALATLHTNPIVAAGGVHFLNVSVTSGVTKILPHNLGRPVQHYLVTRSQGAAAITLRDGVLVGGLTIAQALAVIPSATGTIDVWVF